MCGRIAYSKGPGKPIADTVYSVLWVSLGKIHFSQKEMNPENMCIKSLNIHILTAASFVLLSHLSLRLKNYVLMLTLEPCSDLCK